MKRNNARRGFTLIELLVVVLIIGILAAVALPQYQKVVRKAQAREVFVAIDALEKAIQTYYLETGSFSFYNTGAPGFQGNDTLHEVLSVTIPELKHWRYNDYSFTNPKMQFDGLKTRPNSSDTKQHVWLTPANIDINYAGGNRGLYVQADWNDNGQLENVECVGSLSFPSCADYFDCPPTQPTTTIQVICGEEHTVTSYAHTCKLK